MGIAIGLSLLVSIESRYPFILLSFIADINIIGDILICLMFIRLAAK